MQNNPVFPEGTLFVVTGGAGFIGTNLCEALLRDGYRVRCLDNLSNGFQANVDLFAVEPNYAFVKGDIRDLDTCLAVCDDADDVLHQAAWGSVPRSIEMPLLYEDINTKGTLNMLEAVLASDQRHKTLAALTRLLLLAPADQFALADFLRVSPWNAEDLEPG